MGRVFGSEIAEVSRGYRQDNIKIYINHTRHEGFYILYYLRKGSIFGPLCTP